MKKVLTSLLAFVCALAMLTGCGNFRPDDDDKWNEDLDPSKTQLYVSNLKGGIGHDWLYNVKKRFEAAYADHSFEDGKTGIQVVVDTDNAVNGAWLILPTSEWEVFFSENVPFNDYASQGQLLDISDVVKAPAFGESAPIENKLDATQKSALTAMDGKYYALPHYEAYRGLSYNVSVFEEYRLYLADDRDNGNNGFIIRSTDKRSAGPNGEYGDYDDGLPATVDEFFKLCDQMVQVGVTPFVWPGAVAAYSEYIVDAFAQAFIGAEEMRYNFTFDSGEKTTEIITGFDGDTPITERIAVTNENGYLLRQQAGKYYGYAVFEKIMKNVDKYVYSLAGTGNTTFTHYDSQEEFLLGEFENKPIGMISDGNYWWNEAQVSGAYQRSVNQFGDRAKAENRRFAWMPVPGVWSAAAGQTPKTELVMKDPMKSYCFVNGNIADTAKVAAAKAFVSFCYSDLSLQEFTVTTGVAKGLEYELTDEQFNALHSYGRSCWTLRKAGEVVRYNSANRLFMENEQAFSAYLHRSTVSGQTYQTPFTAFRDGVSAKDYFSGNWISQSDWNRDYSDYFAV